MWIEEVKDKDGNITAYKFVKRYQDEDGKTRRVSVNMKKNTPQVRNKAEAVLNEKIEKALNNGTQKGTGVTFLDMAEDWLKLYKLSVKNSTFGFAKSMVKALAIHLGGIEVRMLKATTVNNLFMNLLVEENLTYRWVNQLKSVFSRIIKHAYIYHGINRVDMLTLINIPKINLPEKDDLNYLEPDELSMVFDYLTNNNLHEIKRLVYLQVHTGMRFGELASLRYEKDIDLDEKLIHIHRTFDFKNKVYNTPKTGSERTIFFNDEVKRVVLEQIQYDKKKILFRNIDRGNKLLFKSVHGNPFPISYTNDLLGEIKIPNKKITTHIFRHTFISIAVQNGMSKDLIAKQVGHTDTQMIDRVYAHFTKDMQSQQKEAMLDFKII